MALMPSSRSETELPKFVERFETSGPVDYYVCKICKGRVNPLYFEFHLKTKHPDAK